MNELHNSPIADFDWEAYEHGDTKGERSHEELEHAYEESLNSVKDKEVIEGTIIALNKREAVVNIDYKSDGIIPMSEFRYNPDIKVGDKVEVFIENRGRPQGPADSFAQESTCQPFLGAHQCRPRKQRNHQGLHQMPYQRRHDRRRVRYRGLPPRLADRC